MNYYRRCDVCEEDFRRDYYYMHGHTVICSERCAGHFLRRQRVGGDDAYEESPDGFTWRGITYDSEEELEDEMFDSLYKEFKEVIEYA